ncbi:MAG: hypothetical protein ACHREM_12250 [Polyangiales bacterium]
MTTWTPIVDGFPDGIGSEGGLVRLDEELSLGARVTLEEGGQTAPWSITCGLYGWLCHTIFCATEEAAHETVGRLKLRLEALAVLADSAEGAAAKNAVAGEIEKLVADF